MDTEEGKIPKKGKQLSFRRRNQWIEIQNAHRYEQNVRHYIVHLYWIAKSQFFIIPMGVLFVLCNLSYYNLLEEAGRRVALAPRYKIPHKRVIVGYGTAYFYLAELLFVTLMRYIKYRTGHISKKETEYFIVMTCFLVVAGGIICLGHLLLYDCTLSATLSLLFLFLSVSIEYIQNEGARVMRTEITSFQVQTSNARAYKNRMCKDTTFISSTIQQKQSVVPLTLYDKTLRALGEKRI